MIGPQVTIIIPTLNEAVNLPVLIPRIAGALIGRRYEILIVDDSSPDRTPQVCDELAQRFPLQLIVRRPENGLSGAVLEGFKHARGEFIVVMDADLQHPPEAIPDLLAPLVAGQADFVLGSRYVAGGTTGREWSLFRRLNSRVATLLARPCAGPMQDPMSGFFAIRHSCLDDARCLTPLGYKIALELLCKCQIPADRVREVPIDFAARHAGQSKLSLKQQFKYLEHLSRLYDFCFPRWSPVLKFILATTCAWMVGLAVYVMALSKSAAEGLVAPPPALAVAYAAAIITTAVFHLRYTRTQRPFLIRPRPWRDFTLISLCEWAVACAVAMFCSRRVMQVTAAELFVFSFAAATVVRYVLRKELLQDIRGLRTEIRVESQAAAKPAGSKLSLTRRAA